MESNTEMSNSDFHYRMSVIADKMEEQAKEIWDGPVNHEVEAVEVEKFMQRIESSIADIRRVMHPEFEDVNFTEVCAQ